MSAIFYQKTKKMIKVLFPRFFMFCSVARASGIGLYLLNFFFQKLMRINSNIPVLVNFSSKVVGNDIVFLRDRTTLVSLSVSGGVYIQAINGVTFGARILIAPGVKIISANHDKGENRKSIASERIVIGDDVWIGANAIILPKVNIADNCIIGAGAVVTKSIGTPGSIVAGNPAKVIGFVDSNE